LDQGADLGQHVRGLDKYMAHDVGKLSLKFFDPTTRFIFSSSSSLRDYVGTCHIAMTVLIFVYAAPCGAYTNFFYIGFLQLS
jgi:hypothetical protein